MGTAMVQMTTRLKVR